MHADLKAQFRALGIQTRVRANRAGCLDRCAFGVSVVVYPEQVWYSGVTRADVSEIVASHILNGVPVARLMKTRSGPTK